MDADSKFVDSADAPSYLTNSPQVTLGSIENSEIKKREGWTGKVVACGPTGWPRFWVNHVKCSSFRGIMGIRILEFLRTP